MKRHLTQLVVIFLMLIFTRATAAIYYVNANNIAPAPPFSTWTTAATNIQDAIAATSNGDIVLVTNGVYTYGGAIMAGDLANRVALTNAITVQSVNGPSVTTIQGAGATNGSSAVRCAWLTNGASLVGFTLTGGATRTMGDTTNLLSGGGIWCASSNTLVSGCVIISNTANTYGGGVWGGTVTSCLITTNRTTNPSGGAAALSVLKNCTIISNGTYGATSPMAMTNCIIYYNFFQNYSASGTAFSHCCATPALSGTGNFNTAPQFFADGVHLATNSPCIGAGIGPVPGVDLFGQPWSNPPSIGCAEWQPSPLVTTPRITLSSSPVGLSLVS